MRFARAQNNWYHANATLGLRAGTQMLPGFVINQAFGLSHLTEIIDGNGNRIGADGDISLNIASVALSGIWVTHLKILGAQYGMLAGLPFVNRVIELDSLDLKPKFGMSDW